MQKKSIADGVDQDDEVDFTEIVKNEEADLRGNFEVFSKRTMLFPHYGPMFTFYNFFYVVHKAIVAFYIPYKCAFEGVPTWGSVAFDFYLEAIFFMEIILTFNLPVYDQKQRLVTDRKKIALNYIQRWFFLDMIVLFPFSYFKKVSEDWPRSSNNLLNFVSLNFNSVPRFYEILLISKIIRMRKLEIMTSYCMKKL